jgi:hypothetical protein
MVKHKQRTSTAVKRTIPKPLLLLLPPAWALHR